MVRQISVFENNFVLDSHFLLRQNFQETIWQWSNPMATAFCFY